MPLWHVVVLRECLPVSSSLPREAHHSSNEKQNVESENLDLSKFGPPDFIAVFPGQLSAQAVTDGRGQSSSCPSLCFSDLAQGLGQ